MSDLIIPAVTLFRFNSEILSVGLADLSQEHAVKRMKKGSGSSIAFLTGHVASSRYGLLKTFGAASENPYAELFGSEVGSKDGSTYPAISELKAGWDEAAEKLHAALDALTDEDVLAAHSGFPIPDQTVRGRLAFMSWHESYHIGQIGILRTEMGYPSMRKALYEARKS